MSVVPVLHSSHGRGTSSAPSFLMGTLLMLCLVPPEGYTHLLKEQHSAVCD